MLAYPPYTSKGYIPPSRKGKKQTVFRKLMNEFLGEKNYKGQYFDNRLAYLKQNNSTNYLDGPASRSGVKLSEGPQAHRVSKDPKAVLRPFSLNRFTVTNTLVSKDMKQEIVADVESGKSLLAVAVKYKMKIPRVEAILKLNEIEKQFEASGKKTPDLATFASVMNKAFPLYDPQEHGENLTEIPIPSETLHSRFVTIAESEPFGPVDAAKEFGLEPAAETLRKVTEEGEDALNKRRQTRIQKTFVAPMHQGDTTAFKFTDVKVGQVGFRYGKPYRDNRKDRKYAFDNAGNMYAVLE
ncbi:hypothetical protein OGAPHI_004748 [Ogataea philodendri]|uniref:37S ribosomal protein S35, mitochondrial n=1 Tax=Ogataea philodendri TaxID=1378263 RepID=A0A9P8P3J3_9ASCO|nr:uncharacterized protein OGAPHI_004748 [Ogataea philodendri]KAH3664034.1 hypothetical protein OGAPHI_004748 [Ogataea philodendri]